MTHYIPTAGPGSWQALLGEPDLHWKTGRSARTLARCWESADGFPPEVARVLDASPYESLHSLEFVAGFPEHKVPLPGGSTASQTDVFVLGRNSLGLVSIAVEGKVDEPFDRQVGEWLGSDPSPGKRERLESLCEHLGITVGEAMPLRYQLMHRTASAIIERDRFHAATAVMLVHSWAANDERFDDYTGFVTALGGTPGLNSVTSVGSGPALHVGWVKGDPEWLTA